MGKNIETGAGKWGGNASIKIGDKEGFVGVSGRIGPLDKAGRVNNQYARLLESTTQDGWFPGTYSRRTVIFNAVAGTIDVYNDGFSPLSGAVKTSMTYDAYRQTPKGRNFDPTEQGINLQAVKSKPKP